MTVIPLFFGSWICGVSLKAKVSKVWVSVGQYFIFGALYPSKSGLINKHIVKHIVDISFLVPASRGGRDAGRCFESSPPVFIFGAVV